MGRMAGEKEKQEGEDKVCNLRVPLGKKGK